MTVMAVPAVNRVPATVEACDLALGLLRKRLRLAKWADASPVGATHPFELANVRIQIDDVLDRRLELATNQEG